MGIGEGEQGVNGVAIRVRFQEGFELVSANAFGTGMEFAGDDLIELGGVGEFDGLAVRNFQRRGLAVAHIAVTA